MALVRALLAKAEASPFPDEAEAFTAKASELIARYAIDEALLWSQRDDRGAEVPSEISIELLRPYVPQKAVLVHGVSQAMGCRAVRLGASAPDRSETVVICGFEPDLRVLETLLTSLMVQLGVAMLSSAPAGLTPSASASWRRSFIVGFAQEISRRLEQDRLLAASGRSDPEPSEAASSSEPPRNGGGGKGATAPGVALVLRSRAEQVDKEFRRRHPRIRSTPVSAGRSNHGRDAGRDAGANADLQRRRLGSRKSLGPGRRPA